MSQVNSGTIDLEKVHSALLSLDDTNSEALDKLWNALEDFRESIGPDLNRPEFRYIMQTLVNEQITTASDEDLESEDVELKDTELSEVSGGGLGSFPRSYNRFKFKQPTKMLMNKAGFSIRVMI